MQVAPRKREMMKQIEIWQVKNDLPNVINIRFWDLEQLKDFGEKFDFNNYECVYKYNENSKELSLDDIFTKFNVNQPKDFKGHSLSVSDVVVLRNLKSGEREAYYINGIGAENVTEQFHKFILENPQYALKDKKPYKVNYSYDGTNIQKCIATAVSEDEVETYFSNKRVLLFNAKEADYKMWEEAKEKGTPFIDIEIENYKDEIELQDGAEELTIHPKNEDVPM